MADLPAAAESLPLEHHRELALQELACLGEERRFHGRLPVLLLDRCWLRLERVALEELGGRLPPDASAEAPELVRYRQLRAQGWPAHEAEQSCWSEFGRSACQGALLRFWQLHEHGNHGWTLERYLHLVRSYRERFAAGGERPVPLIVLARSGSDDPHRLLWLHRSTTPMRHTCA